MKLPILWRRKAEIATPAGAASVLGTIPVAGTAGTQTLSLNHTSNEMLVQYYRNIYLWRCVDMIAQMASSVELEVVADEDRELNADEEQIDDLLEHPNPQWTGASLQYFIAASLAVANRAFLQRVRGTGGRTLELWPINANEILIKYYAGTKVIQQFEWINPMNASNRLIYPVDEDGDSDIIFITRPALNPATDRSPAAVSAPPAEVFNRILQRCADIVSNAANMTGLLSTDAEMNEAQVQKIKDKINQYRTGGPESGGTVLAASAKWEFQRLSEDPSTALSVDIKNSLARDVCMTFGVPPQLVGISGQDTYNNIALSRIGFMTDTVLPGYVGIYCAALNHALMRDHDAYIEPDIDGLPAMRASRLQLVELAAKATMLSINEQRELLGYAAFDDDKANEPVLLEELARKRLEVMLKYGGGLGSAALDSSLTAKQRDALGLENKPKPTAH